MVKSGWRSWPCKIDGSSQWRKKQKVVQRAEGRGQGLLGLLGQGRGVPEARVSLSPCLGIFTNAILSLGWDDLVCGVQLQSKNVHQRKKDQRKTRGCLLRKWMVWKVKRRARKVKGKREGRRKQKSDKVEDDEDYLEDGEMELEGSWREFVMAQIMRMDMLLEGLVRETAELRKEVKEMWKENTEDRQEYFREVRKV